MPECHYVAHPGTSLHCGRTLTRSEWGPRICTSKVVVAQDGAGGSRAAAPRVWSMWPGTQLVPNRYCGAALRILPPLPCRGAPHTHPVLSRQQCLPQQPMHGTEPPAGVHRPGPGPSYASRCLLRPQHMRSAEACASPLPPTSLPPTSTQTPHRTRPTELQPLGSVCCALSCFCHSDWPSQAPLPSAFAWLFFDTLCAPPAEAALHHLPQNTSDLSPCPDSLNGSHRPSPRPLCAWWAHVPPQSSPPWRPVQ